MNKLFAPFAVGTIEEDFKRIGLISEAAAPKELKAPKMPSDEIPKDDDAEPDLSKAKPLKLKKKGAQPPKAEDVESEIDTEALEDMELTPEELEYLESLSPEELEELEALEDTEDDTDADADVSEDLEDPETEEEQESVEGAEGEALDERVAVRRKRRITGRLRMKRRKMKLQRRRKKSRLARGARKWRRSSRGKRFLRRYKQALRRFHGSVPRGKRMTLRAGLDNVSNLIEEVQDIVTSIDNVAKEEAIRTFANIALIANSLNEKYAYACDNIEAEDEDGEEFDLCGIAKHFEEVATEAAEIAESLHESLQEGVEFEGTPEELQEAFAAMMDSVLEGLELFAELSEQELPEQELPPAKPDVNAPPEDKKAPEGEDEDDEDEKKKKEKEAAKAAAEKGAAPADPTKA